MHPATIPYFVAAGFNRRLEHLNDRCSRSMVKYPIRTLKGCGYKIPYFVAAGFNRRLIPCEFMTMMKRLLVILGVLIFVAGSVVSAYRLWRILPYPIATGESKKSSVFQMDGHRLAAGQAIASISGRHSALNTLERHRFFSQ